VPLFGKEGHRGDLVVMFSSQKSLLTSLFQREEYQISSCFFVDRKFMMLTF
jgi:hypothetical protein